MMNLDQVLSTSACFDELCTRVKYHGGKVTQGDPDFYGNLVVFSWTPSRRSLKETVVRWKGRDVDTVVVDSGLRQVVALGLPMVRVDDYCSVTEACIKREQLDIFGLYDGRAITLFYYSSKWWKITEDHLEGFDTIHSFRDKTVSIEECWQAALRADEEEFLAGHEKNTIYVYHLLHHKDRRVIDYTSSLGPDYAALILVATRNQQTMALSGPMIRPHPNVIIPNPYRDLGILDSFNREDAAILSLEDIRRGGIWVFIGETLIALHSTGMSVYMQTSEYHWLPGSSEHYLSLYQNNNLDTYLERFRGNMYYNGFQIKGLIDSIFKILTSEILYLFKLLWDIKYGSQREEYRDIYAALKPEYRKMFYVLRGIYFSRRIVANKYVSVKTVYDMLKKMDPVTFIILLKERQQLLSDTRSLISMMIRGASLGDSLDKSMRVIDEAITFVFTHSTTS